MDPPVAVPENVGVVSLVRLSFVDAPVSLKVSRSGVDGVDIVYEMMTCPASEVAVEFVVSVAPATMKLVPRFPPLP